MISQPRERSSDKSFELSRDYLNRYGGVNMEYNDAKNMILSELQSSLTAVNPEEVEKFVAMITSARKVFTIGVGRSQLSLLAMVKRLNHLGIDANFVGAINEPAITADDVLIVGSGSGETGIPVTITKIAKKYNAKVIHICSNSSSTVSSMADLTVRIPCRTKLSLEDEIDSKQPMSSLFEQSLLLLGDIAACMIIDKRGLDLKDIWKTHANLE
jgi:6-phospho-3-hexuloisomerase